MNQEQTSPAALAQHIIDAISAAQFERAQTFALMFTERYPQDVFGWKALGICLMDLGQFAAAVDALTRGSALGAQDAELLNSLGNALTKVERFAEAEQAFKDAIELEPGFVEAHANLCALLEQRTAYRLLIERLHVLMQLQPQVLRHRLALLKAMIHAKEYAGAREAIEALPEPVLMSEDGMRLRVLLAEKGERHEDALALYESWVTAYPEQVDAWLGLGRLQYRLGLTAQGQESVSRALALGGTVQRVYVAVAEGLLAAKRLDDAIVVLQHLTESHPEMALAWAMLGGALMTSARALDAVMALRKAASLAPNNAGIQNNLGVALMHNGEYADAQVIFEQLLAKGDSGESVHQNLANVALELGQLDAARTHVEAALEIDKSNATLHLQSAKIHYANNEFALAQAKCNDALKIDPKHVDALNYMAHMAQDNGHFGLALSLVNRALVDHPEHAQSYMHLGNIYKSVGLFKESLSNYVKGLELKPNDQNACSNMLFALNYVAEVSPATALNEARRFGAIVARETLWHYDAWTHRAHDQKIRVGFVSGDLREHPVGYFIEALLKHLDAGRFELMAYHATTKEDRLTARVKPYFKQWLCVHGISDENLAQRIHDDGVHILLDLSGHTGNSRLSMFAHKPAPVQVAYLGYFATTGLPEIDYILGDRYVTPQADAAHFSEKIWQLPHSYWCYTPPSSDVAVGPLPAESNGYVTFGCFNNTSKINTRVLDTWSEVLRAVPDSRLILKARQLDDKMLCEALRTEFGARGIASDRVDFEGWSGYVDYLEAYNKVDIGLDPFPFPGGTTTMDSLWMGAPVVAIKGDRLVGHNAETVAHNAGLGDWVSANTTEYVQKAVQWSQRRQELAALRAGMRERLLASPLMDGALFAKSVGDAIEGMCATHPATRGDAMSPNNG